MLSGNGGERHRLDPADWGLGLLMGPALLGHFSYSGPLRPTPTTVEAWHCPSQAPALFPALQTLVGKDGGSSGASVQGAVEGARQEQMRPACLSRPVSCLLWSSRPPLSAWGAKAAPWEGFAKLHESQAPRQSLTAPARLKPVSEMHGGIKCSPN